MTEAEAPETPTASGWRITPGSSYAVLTPAVGLVLPAEIDRSRVASLWQLADGGASFDELLDALLAEGLSTLSAFVVIGAPTDGEPWRVLVRGAAQSVTVHGAEGAHSVDASVATTWVEHTSADVRGVEVTLAGAGAGAGVGVGPVAIEAGLLRVDGLAIGETDEPDETPDTPVATAVPAFEEPEPAPEPELEDDDLGEPTQMWAASAPEPPPAPPTPEPPPAPAFPPPTEPPTEFPSDLDDETAAGGDGSEFAREPAGIPGQQQPPEVTRAVATLKFSGGERVDVDRVVLIGRAPEARRFTASEQPQLVTVKSPMQEISATHVEVRPGSGVDHGSAVVTDMGSTNGTVLIQPGLDPEELKPGIAVQLLPGAVINLGDGVTITVSRPGS